MSSSACDGHGSVFVVVVLCAAGLLGSSFSFLAPMIGELADAFDSSENINTGK